MMDAAWEGLPMLPDLAEAAQLRAFSNSSFDTAHSSLGMTLISANTLTFGFIDKDRPHGNIKKYLGIRMRCLEAWSRYLGF
jgi:hypothetical protein